MATTEAVEHAGISWRIRRRADLLTAIVAAFAAGAAVTAPLVAFFHDGAPGAAGRLERTWSTSQAAAYLGLADASSFASGIACQIYIQQERPYRWIVTLCHR